MYVITRRDIPAPHQSVQIAHAAIAATHAFHDRIDGKIHPHLVVCAVNNESELVSAFNRLKEQGIPCCEWREDDMDNQATAIATAPLQGKERKPLRDFQLLQ